MKKTLVALDLLVKYADGKFEFLVLKPITEKEAGLWCKSTWTFHPHKKIKNIRVLCLNYDAPADASFKEIEVSFQDDISVPESNKVIKLENRVSSAVFSERNGQLFLVSFFDKTTGREQINKSFVPRNLWNIFLTGNKTDVSLEADSGDMSFEKKANTLSVIWKNVKVANKPIDFTVTAAISLNPNTTTPMAIPEAIAPSDWWDRRFGKRCPPARPPRESAGMNLSCLSRRAKGQKP